ncbi:MAG TPA: flagellar hook protein FlgE [Firmicutes bacterium]|nr:flagellar hook protein FlgE [Candidatus Fermentithermobacillaceae bacterium]
MMRSLFSAVSGLRAHQTRMDVIGNNIANVNTPGYKSSRVTFQEVFSQTLRGASSPTGTNMQERGGTNPLQVGLGVTIASIDTIQTPGNLQPTSRLTDVAIEGNGFFVVSDGGRQAYTRVGNFTVDGDGVLVDYEGRKVLGWSADSAGALPADRSERNLGPITIAVGSNMPASATKNVSWIKNLDAEAAVGTVKTTTATVYDSLGATHVVTIEFRKTATNEWSWTATAVTGAASPPSPPDNYGSGTLQFDSSGALSSTAGSTQVSFNPTTGASPVTIDMDFKSVTQVAGPTTIETGVVDGWPTGTLESFTFDSTGTISGFYSNGMNRVLGQIALANFPNPGGLQKAGKSLFVESNNSGDPDIGIAGTSGRGTIAPSSLEMSNVDLAEEFTQMIITQRGFQANSRIITVSDELLQELVNLKR